MKIETRAVHAGRKPEGGSRDVVPAIHLSTTFHKADDGSLPGGYLYGRPNNPNRESLEHALASLEEGAAALAFSSGSAATLAVFQSLAPGDHVIAAEDAYYGTPILLRTVMANWGLKHTLVNMQDLDAVERAITPATRLLWTETPSNPLLNVTDLRAVVALAKKAGALVACDNTWATPLFQLPLNLGVDVVMHSVTKYLSGHSDVTVGALIFKDNGPLLEKIGGIQREGGAVPSPFECWLTLRGLQTFPYRVRAHAENAQRVAEFLSTQPKSKIEAVHYPGLPTHSGHKLATAQMSGFGGMMSIQVRGGQAEAFKLVSGLQLFSHATSLGSTHSLIEHRASVEGANTRSPVNLLRLSIGLEHPDDLIEDLERALKL
ncbi:MAG TPA: aminotransferase class I/II-fold pyridoxal phosphate-dependent enzyme [Candidatus Angelobacter sp.]|jgi:cystathionine gamma-synthase|nr:aminotransferase class I/II-fold pyridoxal phosphate-dependent enzyme [Candidatus Angelobacter sp.]